MGTPTLAHDYKRPADHNWPGATLPMWHGDGKNPLGNQAGDTTTGILQRASRFEDHFILGLSMRHCCRSSELAEREVPES